MNCAGTGFRLPFLGAWTEEREFLVDAERIAAYALATNDDHPRHLQGEIAPPLFAVVPVQETVGFGLTGPMSRIVLRDLLMSGLHSEHDLRVHQPIRPGMVLKVKAAPVGVCTSARGAGVVVRFVSCDGAGEPVNDQYFKAVLRAARPQVDLGEEMPDHRLPAEVSGNPPIAVFTRSMDQDQTFRYAKASGDDMIVHLDEAAARAVGLPGIIVHGLCTMAMVSQGLTNAVCNADPTRLQRIAVRFSRALRPGQRFTTLAWRLGPLDGAALYGFESLNDDGQAIIKDGLLVVRPTRS